MTLKNKYLYRSHIFEKKFRQILRLFCQDFDATKISLLTGVSRKTINIILGKMRERIFSLSLKGDKFSGEVEIDESYFGARRVRDKRGRGASGKTPVVGLLKRGGKVFTKITPNCTQKELLSIIKGKVPEDSHIYTDGWKSYDGLVLNGYHHYRIHHHENEFARGKNHVNGTEAPRAYARGIK